MVVGVSSARRLLPLSFSLLLPLRSWAWPMYYECARPLTAGGRPIHGKRPTLDATNHLIVRRDRSSCVVPLHRTCPTLRHSAPAHTADCWLARVPHPCTTLAPHCPTLPHTAPHCPTLRRPPRPLRRPPHRPPQHTRTRTRMRMLALAHTHARARAHAHTHTHTHTHTHAHAHTRTRTHTHTHVYIYIHTYTCIQCIGRARSSSPASRTRRASASSSRSRVMVGWPTRARRSSGRLPERSGCSHSGIRCSRRGCEC